MPTYVTPRQIAETFGVDIDTVHAWIKSHDLTVYRFGPRTRRLEWAEVTAVLSGAEKVTADAR